MSVNEKMKAIADAIREKTSITEPLTLDAMAENIPFVYEKGKTEGVDEGLDTAITIQEKFLADKPKTHYDAFWDVMQRNGGSANYIYAFAYNRFCVNETDLYNPKHDIVISEGVANAGTYLYAYSTKITDTKVDIYANKHSINGMFTDASGLKHIRKLVMQASTVIGTTTFRNCTKLETMNVEGIIGQNGLNLQWSTLLNKASIESIINALSTTTEGLTVTLSQTAVDNAFETAKGAADGSTSVEWEALEATKSNWNISLVQGG